MSYSKLRFIFNYFYYRLRIPMDVKVGRSSLLIAEAVWLLNRVVGTRLEMPKIFERNYYETIFGKFNITPDLLSTIAVSPSFEREDIIELTDKIEEHVKKRKRILFIDIGAYFGFYTITIGNKFKKYSKLDILSFEPGTQYLSLPTNVLLKKNVRINGLKNVKLNKYGIGSRNGINKWGIKTKKLESAIPKTYYKKYDVVFIKMDIDDYVLDGLKGIEQGTSKFKEVHLLVEDFVKPNEVFKYLNRNYSFVNKLSPYNSFWMKKK